MLGLEGILEGIDAVLGLDEPGKPALGELLPLLADGIELDGLAEGLGLEGGLGELGLEAGGLGIDGGELLLELGGELAQAVMARQNKTTSSEGRC